MKEGIVSSVCALFICMRIQGIAGFPSGAPSGACNAFVPSHGASAQSSAPPFEILVSRTNYSADVTVDVTLQATDNTNFRGFLIIARPVTHDSSAIQDSAIGSFGVVGSTKLNCNDKALTHSERLAVNTLSLQWTAPAESAGDIEFQATVVREQVIFWTGVVSEVLSGDAGPTDDPSETSSTEAPPTADFTIDLSECGSTKGCFRRPSGCAASDCDVAASWSRPSSDATYVNIEMVGKQEGWVALGFSEDEVMSDDYVIRCINTGDEVHVENSYNQEGSKFNDIFDDTSLGISEEQTSFSDGFLKCSFRREISLPSSRRKRQTSGDTAAYFNVDQEYHLLLGFGPVQVGSLSKHEETPLASSEKVTVTTDTADVGASLTLLKVHGILMIIAWLILIDVSLLVARFYKEAWPEQKLLNKDPWFPVHVLMNITAVILTGVSFIIIFVQIDGYSQFSEDAPTQNKAHPVIGIIITALAFINPIMAIFRCTPNDPKRPIFNWFHWAVGITAQVLAIINIFFGISLDRSAAFTPDWVLWVLVAFVVIHGLLLIFLEIHKCYLQKRDKQGDNEMEMKSAGVPGNEQGQSKSTLFRNPHSGLRLKYFMLTLYVVAAVGCGIAVVVGIAITG